MYNYEFGTLDKTKINEHIDDKKKHIFQKVVYIIFYYNMQMVIVEVCRLIIGPIESEKLLVIFLASIKNTRFCWDSIHNMHTKKCEKPKKLTIYQIKSNI